jgi:hypothetical protein
MYGTVTRYSHRCLTCLACMPGSTPCPDSPRLPPPHTMPPDPPPLPPCLHNRQEFLRERHVALDGTTTIRQAHVTALADGNSERGTQQPQARLLPMAEWQCCC